jgi:glucose/arabinose dehydrogenase
VRLKLGVFGAAVAVWAAGLASPGDADAARLARVATFNSPIFMTAPPGAPRGTLFVVERAGRIVRYYRGTRRTFVDITERVSCCAGERGLLSMAFDPGWATNRRVYLFYTNNRGNLVVARYRAKASGSRIVESTRKRLLVVGHATFSNHNGGQLDFGPDGRLYVGTGDGGGGCDPGENAQDLSSRLGKILRINVASGAVSTFMYGVRNPWRFSFDRKSGDFWLGDVGQDSWEEVNFRRASQLHPSSPWNGGWDAREGRDASGCTTRGLRGPGTLVNPVSVYDHSVGCSITGGYVYRGRGLTGLRGSYVFGDYCTGRVWKLRRNADGRLTRRLMFATALKISSFGEGVGGRLYVADLAGGGVYRFARS